MDIRNLDFDARAELHRKAWRYETLKQDAWYMASWIGFGALVGLMYGYFLHWHWGLCALVGLIASLFLALVQVFVTEDVRLGERGGEME